MRLRLLLRERGLERGLLLFERWKPLRICCAFRGFFIRTGAAWPRSVAAQGHSHKQGYSVTLLRMLVESAKRCGSPLDTACKRSPHTEPLHVEKTCIFQRQRKRIKPFFLLGQLGLDVCQGLQKRLLIPLRLKKKSCECQRKQEEEGGGGRWGEEREREEGREGERERGRERDIERVGAREREREREREEGRERKCVCVCVCVRVCFRDRHRAGQLRQETRLCAFCGAGATYQYVAPVPSLQ